MLDEVPRDQHTDLQLSASLPLIEALVAAVMPCEDRVLQGGPSGWPWTLRSPVPVGGRRRGSGPPI